MEHPGRCNFCCKNVQLQFVPLTRYYSVDQVGNNEMDWACGCAGKKRNVYRTLMEQPEGKGPLERPRHRWEGNIKTHLKRIGCEAVYWIDLTQNRASGTLL
jgi:hypothetical protein